MSGSLQVRSALALSELLRGWVQVAPAEERWLTGLTLDSREASFGSLFCALRGTRRHGLELAAQAVAQGSVAVLAEPDPAWPESGRAELAIRLGVPVLMLPGLGQSLSAIAGRFYGEPGRHLDVIGVTGTNGKTSVVGWIAACLATQASAIGDEHGVGDRLVDPTPFQAVSPRCGLVGTLGYGFPDALVGTGYTTPDAVRLQAILAELRERGARVVALEVSSHALDQGRAAGVPVDTAVLTNLTRDHLDYHQDFLDYGQAKRRLFHMKSLRHAVLNADDPFGLEVLASLDPAVEPVLYSLDPNFAPLQSRQRWLRVEALEPLARGMRLRVAGSWGHGECAVTLLGRFNAANLLAVLAVLLLRGLPMKAALERLTKVRGMPGRMECFGQAAQPLVVVDYAHTPDALEQVLEVLRAHRPRRLITLFGCGGERDRGKRPQMGAVAERLSDLVILTDDNPRGEEGEHIAQDILTGMRVPEAVQIERQRGRAIRQAVHSAGVGDIVLIAGKGHETRQRIGDLDYPFSDRVEVTRVLGEEWGARLGPLCAGAARAMDPVRVGNP